MQVSVRTWFVSGLLALTTPLAHPLPASAQSSGGNGGRGAFIAGAGGTGRGFGTPGDAGLDAGPNLYSGGGGGGGAGAAGGQGGRNGGAGGTAGANNASGTPASNGGVGGDASGISGAGGGGGGGTGLIDNGIGNFTVTTASGGTGGNGGNSTGAGGSAGGGGGSGGYGFVEQATANVTVSTSATGGRGGNGGSSAGGSNGPSGGGDGGVGVNFNVGGSTLTNFGAIRGGDGGNGGTGGAVGSPDFVPGNGGKGGNALVGDGLVITNQGTILGGNGGTAGAGSTLGLGGIGIIGSGLTIDNTGGTITGGQATANAPPCGGRNFAFVARNCAIQFNGGANAVSYTGDLLGGIYVAGGSLQPALNGSAVGTTLNVRGPLVFASGTTFNIRITPTTSDSVIASTADFGGARVNVTAGAGTYTPNMRYTIVTVTGGYNGTRFGAVTSNLAFFTPTLTYLGFDIYLDLIPNAAGTPNYTTAASTQNQLGIAQGLTYAGTLGGNANNPILVGLNQLTVPQAQAAFDSLTSEGIAAAQNAAFTAGRLFTGSISDQVLLFGGAPNSVVVPTAPAVAPLTYSAVQALPTPIRVRDPLLSRPLYSWRAWGSVYGASQTINANAVLGNARQSIGVGGGSVGVDYTWAPGMLTGIALGGSDGSFNVGARQTSGSTTGGHAALFTLAEFGPIYAASVNSVSVFGNRTTRTIGGFGGLNSEILRGNFTSTEFRTRVEFGYRFGIMPGVTLTPFYAVEAAKLRSDGFTETPIAGAGLFALNVRGQTASSVPMFFGARLAGDMDVGNGMRFRPSIQVAYVSEFAPVRNQVAGLVNLPGAVFLTDGARPARSSVQVKTGAELAVLDNVAVSANFDGEFSNRSNTYAGKGAIKMRW